MKFRGVPSFGGIFLHKIAFVSYFLLIIGRILVRQHYLLQRYTSMTTFFITDKQLQRIIREEIEYFKSDYDREQHLRDQQQRYQRQRQARNETYPESLRSLARGVLSESELIYNDDESEDYVKIKKAALKRLLIESKEKLHQICNKNGYLKLEQFLKIQSLYMDSSKGKLTKDQK